MIQPEIVETVREALTHLTRIFRAYRRGGPIQRKQITLTDLEGSHLLRKVRH